MINQQILKNGGAEPSAVSSLVSAWKAYQDAKEQPLNKVPHIVCTGIYNAGKSTLLNVLLDTEQFPTGDIPTTKKVAQAEFGGAVYVDTPGLNATEADDQETANAYREADVYLFVSNAQNGGVGAQESEWLRELKERHADETALKRKLVYVLSQCDQLEPEIVEKVRAKTSDDLQSVLGMCPDKIFCVDAHTYRDGKAQNEKLLVDASGIPALRNLLKEKSREAAESLANDHVQELHLRQKVVLDQLNQMENFLKTVQKKDLDKTYEKINAVNSAWKKLETILKQAMPTGDINPISAHFTLDYPREYSAKERTRTEARWTAESAMESCYNSRGDQIQRFHEDTMRPIFQRYCSKGMGSVYFESCNKVTHAFETGIVELQRAGVSVQRFSDISVAPETNEYDGAFYLPSETLATKKVREYVEAYGRPRERNEYKNGLFGSSKMVTYITYDLEPIGRAMERDMQRVVDRNIGRANRLLNQYWQEFQKLLNAEVNKYKSSIQKEADAYCSQLKNNCNNTPATKAITHIAALKKEVQS